MDNSITGDGGEPSTSLQHQGYTLPLILIFKILRLVLCKSWITLKERLQYTTLSKRFIEFISILVGQYSSFDSQVKSVYTLLKKVIVSKSTNNKNVSSSSSSDLLSTPSVSPFQSIINIIERNITFNMGILNISLDNLSKLEEMIQHNNNNNNNNDNKENNDNNIFQSLKRLYITSFKNKITVNMDIITSILGERLQNLEYLEIRDYIYKCPRGVYDQLHLLKQLKVLKVYRLDVFLLKYLRSIPPNLVKLHFLLYRESIDKTYIEAIKSIPTLKKLVIPMHDSLDWDIPSNIINLGFLGEVQMTLPSYQGYYRHLEKISLDRLDCDIQGWPAQLQYIKEFGKQITTLTINTELGEVLRWSKTSHFFTSTFTNSTIYKIQQIFTIIPHLKWIKVKLKGELIKKIEYEGFKVYKINSESVIFEREPNYYANYENRLKEIMERVPIYIYGNIINTLYNNIIVCGSGLQLTLRQIQLLTISKSILKYIEHNYNNTYIDVTSKPTIIPNIVELQWAMIRHDRITKLRITESLLINYHHHFNNLINNNNNNNNQFKSVFPNLQQLILHYDTEDQLVIPTEVYNKAIISHPILLMEKLESITYIGPQEGFDSYVQTEGSYFTKEIQRKYYSSSSSSSSSPKPNLHTLIIKNDASTFYHYKKFTIPKFIKHLEMNVFDYCPKLPSSLESLDIIDNGVRSIWEWVHFEGCSSLKNLKISCLYHTNSYYPVEIDDSSMVRSFIPFGECPEVVASNILSIFSHQLKTIFTCCPLLETISINCSANGPVSQILLFQLESEMAKIIKVLNVTFIDGKDLPKTLSMTHFNVKQVTKDKPTNHTTVSIKIQCIDNK